MRLFTTLTPLHPDVLTCMGLWILIYQMSVVQCITFCELLVLSEADYMACFTYLGVELTDNYQYPQPEFLAHQSHWNKLSQARESVRKVRGW